MKIRIGTRTSELALTQTRWVAARLQELEPGLEVEEVHLKTTGDRDQVSALDQQGGVGLFTKELERALLADECDLAVHSLKDLPTVLQDGLCLAAVPEREEPWDVWISEKYADLRDVPAGGKVRTGSLRRRAQILHAYPHLEVTGIRGNIDTRLARYKEDGDGLILAAAGLRRTGREGVIRATFGPTEMTPAPGQGALGLETRADRPEVQELVGRMDHAATRAAVEAERTLLNRLEAGCHMPVGGIAHVNDGVVSLLGVVATPNGEQLLRMSHEGPADAAADVGRALAETMLAAGAESMLGAAGGVDGA